MLRNTCRGWRRGVLGLAFSVCLSSALALSAAAQTVDTGVLMGTVTDASGAVVANVTVTATSIATGQTRSVTTGADGSFRFDAPRGDYRLKFEAVGFTRSEVASATVEGTAPSVVDKKLEANDQVNGKPPAQQENLPNAPSPSSNTAPSLAVRGLTPEQTQGNAREQALLDKRTHMLKIHQRVGLITTIPLVATVILGPGAGGKRTSNTDRTVHMVLGSVSSDLYFMSAYFAIRAPRVPGTKSRGPIRFHKAMAWIHGPGMILTPILGAMAYSQKSNGEKVHGIASAHGAVAIVTAAAYG